MTIERTEEALRRLEQLYFSCQTWRAVAAHLIAEHDLSDRVDSLASQLCAAYKRQRITALVARKIVGHETRVRVCFDCDEELRERVRELQARTGLSRTQLLIYALDAIDEKTQRAASQESTALRARIAELEDELEDWINSADALHLEALELSEALASNEVSE